MTDLERLCQRLSIRLGFTFGSTAGEMIGKLHALLRKRRLQLVVEQKRILVFLAAVGCLSSEMVDTDGAQIHALFG